MAALRGGAVEEVRRAFGVDEGTHAAAAAGAGGPGVDRRLAGEGLAVVAGESEPHLAVVLAARARDLNGVPGDIDMAVLIGGDGAAAIEGVGLLHQVALLFEGVAGIVQASIEHGRGVLARPARLGLARAVPGDMHAVVFAEGELTAANRADGDGASGLAVDAQRGRERPLARLAP